MSDDNNQKSRGPRKGGGAGGRGGGKDGGSRGGGFGRSGEGRGPARSGASAGGERKPFRSRPEGAERPARPARAGEGGERPFRARPDGERSSSRPPREGGERPFRARPDGERSSSRPPREGGERPFRARPDGERSSSRPPREGGERPFRARPDGERSSSRPPREGGAPRGNRDGDGGKRFEKPRFDRPRSDRPERSRGGSERPRHSREVDSAAEPKLLPSLIQEPERIAKVMARAGVASRRDSEAMIAEGRVSVNGKVLESPALDIGPDDVVLVDGAPLPERERTRLWLYHKPRGLVTTNHDPEGRPTVFDALPEDLPRVLSIGRLDINTEGLLLLTNDGGLARMLELPETGWLRRYRVRAFGSITQDRLDTLRDGVTIEGVNYGPVVARFEREQGSNTWLVVDLREGKNREVKTVLEHLGLVVNRLIRVSFGPFQLGDLPEGEADEVRSRVIRDQLGEDLIARASVDLEAPRRDEMPAAKPAPSRDDRRAPGGDDRPRRRDGAERGDRGSDVVRTPSQDDRSEKPWKRTVWRDAEAEPQRERKAPPRRGADPKLERQTREATGQVERKRGKAIADPKGRRVLVERVSAAARDEAPARERPASRKPREERGGAENRAPRSLDRAGGSERPPRRPREDAGGRDRADERPWQDRGPDRAPRGDRPERAPREGAERPARRFSESSGDKPRGRSFGEKPSGQSYAARSSQRPAGRSADGERSGGKSLGGKSFGGKPSGGKPSGGRPFGGKPGGGGRPASGGRPGGSGRPGGGGRPGGKRG
jgi:23S rRNA pseudouridine2605 synthase